MKTRMRPRYYCDHCGKGSGSAWAMRRHEKSCTANRNRVCLCCAAMMGEYGFLVEGAVAFLAPGIIPWRERMKALRAAVDDCPCCILAVIRQTGAMKSDAAWQAMYADDEAEFSWEARSAGIMTLGFHFRLEMERARGRMDELRDEEMASIGR